MPPQRRTKTTSAKRTARTTARKPATARNAATPNKATKPTKPRTTTKRTTRKPATARKATTPNKATKPTKPRTTTKRTTRKPAATRKATKTTERGRAGTGKAPKRTPGKTTRSSTRKTTAKRRPAATGPAEEAFPQITLQPMLMVPDVDAEIAFLEALGFQTTMKMPAPGGTGTMHAVLTLNNAMVHLDPIEIPGMPPPNDERLQRRIAANRDGPLGLGVSLYVQVDDVEAVHRTVERLGAQVVSPPMDQFWGDRTMMFVDPAGYWWSFAQHIRDVAPEDMTKAMEMMPPSI